ncbi:uncharacterized protein [Antedon mediterranea]|uniref:uncharacterized protein n=1 Tax=Antedon mediterranea TaxID=105859 RepID=UPI003AF4E12B
MSPIKYVCATIYVFAIVTTSHESLFQNQERLANEGTLLNRQKRMGGGSLIKRCWEDVNLQNGDLTRQDKCIKYTQYGYTCYTFLPSSENYENYENECNGIADQGYEPAKINSVLILDAVAKMIQYERDADEYWLQVDPTLQDVPDFTEGCSEYNMDFNVMDDESTVIMIKSMEYEINKKRRSQGSRGFVCQKYRPTTETPFKPTTNTPIRETSIDRDVTDDERVTSKATLQEEQKGQSSSKMSDAVIPISIALGVAIVCIVILVVFILYRRRSSQEGVATESDQPKEQNNLDSQNSKKNEPRYTETINGGDTKEPDLYSKYRTSLPGDYAYLSKTATQDPDSITVDNEVYSGGQYEYPTLPVLDTTNAKPTIEDDLNDSSYDKLGPSYYVLNPTDEKKDDYIEIAEDQEYSYPYTDVVPK